MGVDACSLIMKATHSPGLWLFAYVMTFCCACVYCTHLSSEDITNRAMKQLATPVKIAKPLPAPPESHTDEERTKIALTK